MRRRSSLKKCVLAILASTAAVASSAARAAPVIQIGDAQVIYTPAQMPFFMDGNFATLNNGNGTTTFFESSGGVNYRYTGTPDNPLQTPLPNFTWNNVSNVNTGSGEWLYNVYQVSGGTLLGFVHREDYSAGNNFYQGLAESTNDGASWTYLGNVVAPYGNNSRANAQFSNIGDCPVVTVGNYFYIYYNERTGPNATDLEYPGVARATISSVLAAAANNTVPTFYKYNDGTWNQPALTGLGSPILPNSQATNAAWAGWPWWTYPSEPTNTTGAYDVESNVSYSSALGQYILTVDTAGGGELLLYTSSDGVNWGNKTVVDYANGDWEPYSTLVGFDSSASADSRTVGANFYLYFTRKPLGNYGSDTLIRRQITIGNGLTWDIGQGTGGANFTGGSGTWTTGGNNWNNGSGSATWNTGTPTIATFGGTAGTVTIVGPVTTSGLTFNTSGYVLSGSTLSLGGNSIAANADATIACPLAGSAGLTKTGTGKLSLSGANVFTGPVVVSAGVLSVAADAALGAVPPTAQVDQLTLDGGTLQTTASASFAANRGVTITPNGGTFDVPGSALVATINGVISGSGNLTKTGAGMLLLAASSSYSGTTTVSGGTLLSAASLTCGGVSVAGGATFGGIGSAGAVTVAAGGAIQGGYADAGSLALASLSFGGNGGLNFMPTPGTLAAIAVSGAVSTSGTETVNIASSTPLAIGGFMLLSYGSLGGAGSAAFALGAVPAQGGSRPRTYALDASQAGYLGLTVSGDRAVWTGAAGSSWNTTSSNWKLQSSGSATTYMPADSVIFDDTAANTNVAINGADVSPSSVTFNTAGSYALAGTNGIVGTTFLTKSNSGRLTINNFNSYTGGTTVTGGTLALGNGGQFGVIRGALSIDSGAVVTADAGGQSWSLGYHGANDTGSNSNLVNTIVINNGTLFFGSGGGGLSQSSITMTGGTIAGSQPDWYNGITDSPTLSTNANAATAVIQSGLNVRLAAASSSLTFNVAQGAAPGGIDLLVSGAISSGGPYGGHGGIIKTGPGVIELSAANTYDGGTTVNGGTLTIAGTGSLGGGNYAGTISIAAGAVLNVNSSRTQYWTGTIYGYGTLQQSGPGDLVLNPAVNAGYSNNTLNNVVVNGGTLQTAALNSPNGSIGLASLIVVNSGATISLSTSNYNSLVGYVTSGARQIEINAGGLLVNPGGYSNHLNALVLAGGTLAAAAADPIYGSWNPDYGVSTPGNGTTSYITGGNLALTQTEGTVFNVGAGDTLIISSVIAHSSSVSDTGLIKSGPGLLTLTGVNTYTSGTTIIGGTLAVTKPASLGAAGGLLTIGPGTLEIAGNLSDARNIRLSAAGATIQVDSLLTYRNSGTLSGSGGLSLSGPGRLILSGSNDYTGGTHVNSGTLNVSAADAIPDGSSLTVGQGASALFAPAYASPVMISAAAQVAAVPEPGTLVLLAAGLVMGLGVWLRKDRNTNNH
jgi:fibronectin-binding autotransporter adhesin